MRGLMCVALSIVIFMAGASPARAAAIDQRFISGAFSSLFATKTTDDLAVGTTNLYWTQTLFNTAFGAKTTDNLAVGSTNLYWTQALFNTAFAAKTTDGLTEGVTNLYSTTARIKAAAVVNSLGGSQTDQAPSVASVNAALAGKANALTFDKETITLLSGDITAQHIDLAVQCASNTLTLGVKGASVVFEGADYTLSVVSSKTRVTFAGDLASGGATPLAAADVLYSNCNF